MGTFLMLLYELDQWVELSQGWSPSSEKTCCSSLYYHSAGKQNTYDMQTQSPAATRATALPLTEIKLINCKRALISYLLFLSLSELLLSLSIWTAACDLINRAVKWQNHCEKAQQDIIRWKLNSKEFIVKPLSMDVDGWWIEWACQLRLSLLFLCPVGLTVLLLVSFSEL